MRAESEQVTADLELPEQGIVAVSGSAQTSPLTDGGEAKKDSAGLSESTSSEEGDDETGGRLSRRHRRALRKAQEEARKSQDNESGNHKLSHRERRRHRKLEGCSSHTH